LARPLNTELMEANKMYTPDITAFSPINATSKKPYRGINTVCVCGPQRKPKGTSVANLPAIAG
jgi:hypothetical protein